MIVYIRNCFDSFTFRQNRLFLFHSELEDGFSPFMFHTFSQSTKVISVMAVSLIIYYDAWLQQHEIRLDFNAYDGNITSRVSILAEGNGMSKTKMCRELESKQTLPNDHHLTEFQLSWHYMQFNLKHTPFPDGMKCAQCRKYVFEVGKWKEKNKPMATSSLRSTCIRSFISWSILFPSLLHHIQISIIHLLFVI